MIHRVSSRDFYFSSVEIFVSCPVLTLYYTLCAYKNLASEVHHTVHVHLSTIQVSSGMRYMYRLMTGLAAELNWITDVIWYPIEVYL